MKYKLERIQSLLKREILTLLSKKVVNDPRVPLSINISKITVSRDLHYAHIYFTVIGNDQYKKDAIAGLNHSAGFIQKNIGVDLELKYTPKIEFRYDELYEKAEQVDTLINSINEAQS